MIFKILLSIMVQCSKLNQPLYYRIIMEFIIKFIKSLKIVSQEELNERYLNESTSLYELEARMRQIDRENAGQGKKFMSHNGSY